MKPWLLNILACPMCKHHPLDAYFYTWETPNGQIKEICEKAGKPEREHLEDYKAILKDLVDGIISPPAIEKIRDETENETTKKTLEKVRQTILQLLENENIKKTTEEFKKLEEQVETKGREAIEKEKEEIINSIAEKYLKELSLLYNYMVLLEVKEALLYCPNCGRWYPIGNQVEGIPEMLPDELREKHVDLKFFEKWKEKIPQNILKEGKPFALP